MTRHLAGACALAALLTTAAAPAQIARTRTINATDAQTITDACLALASKSGWKVHVAVLNEHGDLVRFVGMDGASRTSAVLAQGKAGTVFRTGRSTAEVAKMAETAQRAFNAVTYAGGLPVMVDGRLAGTVGVSGATEAQDEECARAGIAAAL
ncbi:GlcG/HbpS family heme-binding protein [Sphingomonas flavalba]|uniref:GlcG/HbpS family heme-binding protein n=1 Tax=Sphingomonas flavalba TaxID=2559804 RepID=UPI0014467E72|nr:heme-binding protein [Sphingomonas flavalba]